MAHDAKCSTSLVFFFSISILTAYLSILEAYLAAVDQRNSVRGLNPDQLDAYCDGYIGMEQRGGLKLRGRSDVEVLLLSLHKQ